MTTRKTENNKVIELVSTNLLDRNLFTVISNTTAKEEDSSNSKNAHAHRSKANSS